LVIDKPAGPTSHGCVAAVRRAYGLKRVGHGGTLDPAVTGVLPIALGPATRLLPYLRGDKLYRAVVQLGVRTSSDDLEGDLLERRSPPALDTAALEEALGGFRGEILQRPPAVSAVHVGGERAYVRARRGELVELPPRIVTIHSLQLLGWDPAEARLELEVRCSAGTYIRSLARDLGEHLGCGAALARLRRTETLGFDLSTAVDLERLASGPLPPLLDPLLALSHLERRQLQAEELPSWRCGRALPLRAGAADQAGSDPAIALVEAGPARSIAEVLGTPACTVPGAVEGLTMTSCPTPTEAIREASAAGLHRGSAGSAALDGAPGAAASVIPGGAAAPAGPGGSDTPEALAYAILNPDGRLAGIARLDPAGLLRPRLVFDAAG
jgi:tRNA pseudouridine55 synthase